MIRNHVLRSDVRLAAGPLRREVELLAQRARLDLAEPGPASGPARAPRDRRGGLTPREQEVLALIARGYTNREIAEELTISIKTAGVHVSNILRKFGVSRRLDAAAVAHRLVAPPAPERQPTGAGDRGTDPPAG